MPEPDKQPPTDAQKKAAKFLIRPKSDFTAWRKAREEERAQAFAKAMAHAKIGDVMPDGTVYAGISLPMNAHLFVTPQDAAVAMQFNEAAKYTRELDAHGHQDWRLPTIEELQLLFRNNQKGALKGTFNTTGRNGSFWYWSGTLMGAHGNIIRVARFSDGLEAWGTALRGPPNCRPVRLVPVFAV